MHNIGKVVGMSENVLKTEATHYKNNALLVTSAKLHDGIDFDQSTLNDIFASTVSNDRKASTCGNMYEGLSTEHAVKDLSIQSSINTSPIQSLGNLEQPSNVHLKLSMVLENGMKTDLEKKIPLLAGQRQVRKQKHNFQETKKR